MSATCAFIFIPLACRSPSTFRGSSWRTGFRHFALSLFVGFHASIMRRLNDIDTKLVGAYKHQWWALIRQGFRNFISIFRKYPPIKGRVPYFGNLIWLKIASFASFSSSFGGNWSGPLQKSRSAGVQVHLWWRLPVQTCEYILPDNQKLPRSRFRSPSRSRAPACSSCPSTSLPISKTCARSCI